MQAASSDAAGAMQLFEDVAHGDVEQGSIYELSEANLAKVGSADVRCHCSSIAAAVVCAAVRCVVSHGDC
jgi:hypothetical protein